MIAVVSYVLLPALLSPTAWSEWVYLWIIPVTLWWLSAEASYILTLHSSSMFWQHFFVLSSISYSLWRAFGFFLISYFASYGQISYLGYYGVICLSTA